MYHKNLILFKFHLIVIFPNSHVFLSVNSLGDSNKEDLNFIANVAQKNEALR